MDQRVYGVMRDKEERHWWFRGRRAVIGALLERAALPPSTRILDAGCGTGRNLELYAELGTVSGVDPSPDAIEFVRQRGAFDVQLGDAQELPFEEGGFELAAATDVLEHVEDDGLALREMHRVTAPGGALLLTVPAYPKLWTDEDERLGHYRRYTLPDLSERVARAGWEPSFGSYFNTVLLAPIAIARRLPRRAGTRSELERTPAFLDVPLSLPMRLEAKLIRRGVSLPAGVSLGLVCRRA